MSGIIVRTLPEQIFSVIRERIIAGIIPVDRAIRQDALAAELGVSKIPLREALARLEQEGLLFSQANRGYFVRTMSAPEAEEIYALRLAIEPDAVAQGALAATQEGRAAATLAYEDLNRAAEGELNHVAACNREFHMALVRPLNRPLTTQLVERLQALAERYVHKHLEPAGRGDRAHLEHEDLMAAWLERDADRIRALARQHIEGTLNDLRQQLQP